MLLACALSVESTAHLLRHYLISEGTKHERMLEALRKLFLPVLFGAITTGLCVFFMYFSEFPYFQLYYFRLYMLIIGFGLYNGVVVQSNSHLF